jgi:hypothetical protein
MDNTVKQQGGAELLDAKYPTDLVKDNGVLLRLDAV